MLLGVTFGTAAEAPNTSLHVSRKKDEKDACVGRDSNPGLLRSAFPLFWQGAILPLDHRRCHLFKYCFSSLLITFIFVTTYDGTLGIRAAV